MALVSQIWYSVDGGDWNANPAADPTLGIGGYTIIPTEGYLMGPYIFGSGSTMTANFGASAFTYSVPTGFFAGFPNTAFSGWTTFDPATIWSIVPSDPSTLSNGNLTLTTPALTHGGVFASDYHPDGYYYFEVTIVQTAFSFHVGGGIGRQGAFILDLQSEGAYDIANNIFNGGATLTNEFPGLNQAYVGTCGTTVTNNALALNNTHTKLRVAVELHSWIRGVEATSGIGQPTTLVVHSAEEGMSKLLCTQQPLAGDTLVTLQWSDDAGASWSNGIEQSLGELGQYLTTIQFRRLGMARNRVFRIFWSGPHATALTGMALQFEIAAT